MVRGFVATLLAGAFPATLHAQDTNAQIEALNKRVAELEAKLPKDSAAAATPGGDEYMKWNDFQALGSRWKLGGWLRLDAQYDDSRMNDVQLPQWVRSEDPAAPASIRAPNDANEFTMHAKLTRLWLDMVGPKLAPLWDASLSGRLEVDFYNSVTSDSREALRIRTAYLQLKWSSVALSFGQMWDVIAPLAPIVNNDMVMWNAGNLADRRPQVRGEWWHSFGDKKLTVTAMAGQTGAIDNQDLDAAGTTGAGFLDGEQSGGPTWQARVGWKQPISDMKDLEAGVWAHHAHENVDVPVGGDRNFTSAAYGVDLTVPVFRKVVWVKGELFAGRNLDDVRGGIGQNINSATGEEIRSRGGWAEVGFQPDGSKLTYYGGYAIDNPSNDDLPVSARSRNSVMYAAVRIDFKPVLIGFEYLYWVTDYMRFNNGDTNRLVGFIQYTF
jgi:hypothetical protein